MGTYPPAARDWQVNVGPFVRDLSGPSGTLRPAGEEVETQDAENEEEKDVDMPEPPREGSETPPDWSADEHSDDEHVIVSDDDEGEVETETRRDALANAVWKSQSLVAIISSPRILGDIPPIMALDVAVDNCLRPVLDLLREQLRWRDKWRMKPEVNRRDVANEGLYSQWSGKSGKPWDLRRQMRAKMGI